MKYPYGRTILITGGTSGIGKAAAHIFAASGYTVWATGRSASPSAATVTHNGQIYLYPMDVRDESSVEKAVAHILSLSGGIGVLLHCAGFGIGGAAEDTPQADIEEQFAVNYYGVLRVNRHVLPHMRKSGRGLVLVTGSVAGIIPIPFQSHYCATKYALEAYTQALRMELRPFGVNASLIAPGDTRTGFTGARRMALPKESAYRGACTAGVARMARDEQNGYPPEAAARVALRMASKKSTPTRKTVGLEYKLITFAKRLLPDRLAYWAIRHIYMAR